MWACNRFSDAPEVVEVRFTSVDAPRCLVEEADLVSDDPDPAGTMTCIREGQPRGRP